MPTFDNLIRLRMQRAMEPLRDTALPLHEVAGRVETDLAFTRKFRKHAGTTQTRYRKRL